MKVIMHSAIESLRPRKNPYWKQVAIIDEPGIYLEGKFGIRLENLILCVKKGK